MDENKIVQEVAQEQVASNDMVRSMFFGAQMPEQKQEPANPFNEGDVVFDEQPIITDDAVQTTQTSSFNESEWVKQHFMVDSVDELKAKLTTPVIEYRDLEIEDDNAKEVFALLREGKLKEVGDILYQRGQFEGVLDKTPEEKIKAHIKFKYPNFTNADVEDEYNEQYTVDPNSYDDDKTERERKKIGQKIQEDAQTAEQFFRTKLTGLKFPERQQAAVEEPTEDNAEIRKSFVAAFDGIEQKIQPTSFTYLDKKNNIQFPIELPLEQAAVQDAVKKADNFLDYFGNRYRQSGVWDAERIVKDIDLLENTQKRIDAAVSQGIHKYRMELLARQKNVSGNSGSQEQNLPDDARDQTRQLFFSRQKN